MYINLILAQILGKYMQLVEVKKASDIKDFHQVPFIIYKNTPQWIPNLKQDVEKVFDPEKNKLFKEGGEAIRWLLRNDKGDLVGRVATFFHPKTANSFDQPTGGIGFFECVNDQQSAYKLFDACKNWLQAKGMEAMDGPINFGDRNQFWGLQIDRFDEPPIYPLNYHQPYYQPFFESYGFQDYFKQFVFWRDITIPAQPIFIRKYNQLKDNPDFGMSNIRGKSIAKIAEDFRVVYNGAWAGLEHFKEMKSETALKLIKSMKAAFDPDLVIFIYHQNKPVAFYINLPELNQIFRYVKGNLNWLGKLIFLYHKIKKTPTRMTGVVFGVVKEWQGKGLEAALIVYAEKTIVPKGHYKDTVLSWIGDFNPKMIKITENLGTTLHQTFITYRYLFDRTKEFKRSPIQ